jgi:hypothetical protein
MTLLLSFEMSTGSSRSPEPRCTGLSRVSRGNGSESHESPNEVIYLTSQDGVGQSAPSFTIPALQVDFVFPDLGDHHYLLSPTSQDSLPPEIFIPPPKKPPRV